MCVFAWIRRRKHLGGLFLQKWWNRTISPFLRVCMTPCATLYTSVTLYVKVPFLLLFFAFCSFLHLFPYCQACIFSLVLVWHSHFQTTILWQLFLVLTLCILFSRRWICPIQAGPARALWLTAQSVWECYLVTRQLPLPCLSTKAAYPRRAPLQHVPTAITFATITITAMAITAVQRSQILFQSSWNLSLIR